LKAAAAKFPFLKLLAVHNQVNSSRGNQFSALLFNGKISPPGLMIDDVSSARQAKEFGKEKKYEVKFFRKKCPLGNVTKLLLL
jgi:hypothetical protein